MKDNFDLKKFLKENKTIENYNPFTKEKPKSSINEGNVRGKIKEMILKELEDYNNSNLKPLKGEWDFTNLNIIGEFVEYQGNFYKIIDTKWENITIEDVETKKQKVVDFSELTRINPVEKGIEWGEDEPEDFDFPDMRSSMDDLFEAEEEETEEEEEDFTDEDESTFGTIAADMEGAESEVMDNLMSALNVAKGLNNEKLTTQIGNTLKFFVSEYISGGEE